MLSSATGLVVGLVVTIILVAGVRAGVPPFPAIQRAGNDVGLQLLSSFMWLDSDSSPESGYYFVDVDDERSCAAYRAADGDDPLTRCRTQNPVPPAMVADFLDIVTGTDAAVAIVDVSTPDAPEDRAIVETRLAAIAAEQAARVHVILPYYGRSAIGSDGQPLFNRDRTRDFVAAPHPAWLHLSPILTTADPEADDGMIRSFQKYVVVRDQPHPVATAPYLAALLRNQAIGAKARATGPERSLQPAPIIFTVPSLALLGRQIEAEDDPRVRNRLERQRNRYFASLGFRRISFGELVRDWRKQGGQYDPFGPGAVVVLGSSLPTAMDWYNTPVGPMTGSELVLNTTRSFSEALIAGEPQSRSPTFPEELSARIGGLVKAAFVMTVAWLAIYWVWEKTKRRPKRDRLGGKTLIVALFCLGMLGVAMTELADAASGLGKSLDAGRSVDVLTPMLALGLEGYAEGLRVLAASIERRLVALLSLSISITQKLAETLRAWANEHQ